MKISIITIVGAMTLVRAGNSYPRDSNSLVLSATQETCTLGGDGVLECSEGTTGGVDTFSTGSVSVASVDEGDKKTPPPGALTPADAAAVAAGNGSSPAARSLALGTSPATQALDKRWFLFGCGLFACNKCAAKCAYKGYCKSSCSWWGLSCLCSCKAWCFPHPWNKPTCWAHDCRPRYPDGWCHSGGCGGGGGWGDGGWGDDGWKKKA